MNAMQPPQSVEEVKATLETTEKGGVRQSIRNCLTVFQRDPVLAGAIAYNILTDRKDIIKPIGFHRESTALTDTDMKYLLLYLEETYAPCQRHGGCGENCRCADDPDRELPKIQPQRNRMDGAAVMGGLQTAGQPAGGCETESRLGGMADGIPPEMDGHSMWAKEPAQIPYLISDPPANVAKRLKTLGNAVVPPQVYPILRYIAEIETGRCRNRQQGGDRIWNP